MRVWVLAAGPNVGSSFHVVGGQFDTVFHEGAYRLRPGSPEQGGAQALGLTVAQGGFVELELPEAGTYPFVTSSSATAGGASTGSGVGPNRLDRIVAVDPLEQATTDHGPAPALASGWLDDRPDAVEVTLDLRPGGRWITEYHPLVATEELPDGLLRVRMRVADPGWFRRLLLRLGPAVARVDPPQAAASAIEAAREALGGDR